MLLDVGCRDAGAGSGDDARLKGVNAKGPLYDCPHFKSILLYILCIDLNILCSDARIRLCGDQQYSSYRQS